MRRGPIIIGYMGSVILMLLTMIETIPAQQPSSALAVPDDQNRWDLCQGKTPATKLLEAQLEQSYITFGGGGGMKDRLLFEAKVAPNLIIDCSERHTMFVITPKTVLRMFNEFSAPVKTPSYMPRATLYWLPWEPEVNSSIFPFLSLTVSHHSNGQSGKFFTEDGRNNHENGSFSTNYVDLASHFSLGKNGQSFIKVSAEYHPPSWGDEELKNNYGLLRLNLSLRGLLRELYHLAETNKETHIAGGDLFELTYIADKIQDNASVLNRIIASATYTLAPQALRDIGFFINFYYGQDYYNIRFDDTIKVIRAGIIANFNAFAR